MYFIYLTVLDGTCRIGRRTVLQNVHRTASSSHAGTRASFLRAVCHLSADFQAQKYNNNNQFLASNIYIVMILRSVTIEGNWNDILIY
jgi:hypothetical protein